MKIKAILIALGCLAAASSYAQNKTCGDSANDQSELNACASTGLQKEDDELNRVYKKILANFANDHIFINKLKVAQRAWIAFRDAQLEALYPPSADKSEYGSAASMCILNEKARLTAERTKQLRVWLDGQAEGDVCVGSIPVH
jgi:uncharacterized protein YecT (DUF1311 family)